MNFYFNSNAQNIHLKLTERVEDAQYSKLLMVLPVFAFKKDSVANPIDISSAQTTDKVEWRKVQLPKFNSDLRSGFAWIFNGSAPRGFWASHTLLCIQNPGWTYYNSLIWIDRNNNFDLTDDGPPDTIVNTAGVTLKIGEGENGYKVFLEHFPAAQFPLFTNINDAEIAKLKGARTFYGTSNSFRERRLNAVAGRWNNGVDSFSFAIKDVNCNGKYDEAGIDVAMITDLHGAFDNLQGVVLDKKSSAYLEWNNCSYRIAAIEKNGLYVDLERDSIVNLKYSLNIGQKIPKFKYCTATKPQKRNSIRKMKGRYTYVYLWRDGAEAFTRDSADLHDLGRINNPNFKVLALNFGGSGRYVYQYNKRYHTDLLQGFSSNSINDELKIKKIPLGILVDRKQRIVAVGITPSQAKQLVVDLSIL